MKYLAIDVLKLAGVESPEDKIGKVSVSVGGVVVNDPKKIINLLSPEIQVIVGRELFTAVIPETQSEEHVDNVHAEKERLGRIASEPYFAREAAKEQE